MNIAQYSASSAIALSGARIDVALKSVRALCKHDCIYFLPRASKISTDDGMKVEDSEQVEKLFVDLESQKKEDNQCIDIKQVNRSSSLDIFRVINARCGLPEETTTFSFIGLSAPSSHLQIQELIGLFIVAWHDGNELPFEPSTLLASFSPLMTDAFLSQRRDYEEKHLENIHSSIVQLSRFADGDLPASKMEELQGTFPPLGTASIFSLGAEIILSLFRHDDIRSCLIFDASCVRFVDSSVDASDGSDEKEGASGVYDGMPGMARSPPLKMMSTGKRQSMLRDSSFRPKLGRGSSDMLAEQKSGTDGSNSNSNSSLDPEKMKADARQHTTYVASTKGMGGQIVFEDASTTPQLTEESMSTKDSAQQVISEESDPRSPQGTGTAAKSSDYPSVSGSASSAEAFLQAAQDAVLCRFTHTTEPVPLLACQGITSDAERNIIASKGVSLRTIMAGYFASARQSEHGAQVSMEVGAQTENGPRIRQLLQRDEDAGGILCSACIDASLQPSFFLIATFDAEPYVSRARCLLVEQVGITLAHALLQKRAKAIDYAQQTFMQKVQHELRTPMHAIIGVNETVRFAIKTAREDNNRLLNERKTDGQGTTSPRKHSLPLPPDSDQQKARRMEEVMFELDDLSESISGSADRLSALIDDLVDFSLVQRGAGSHTSEHQLVRDGFLFQRRTSRDRSGEVEYPESSKARIPFSTLMSIIDHTLERLYAHFRRPRHLSKSVPPPPELVVCVAKDTTASLLSDDIVEIDADCLRRVIWKLAANAVGYTSEGLVQVKISCSQIHLADGDSRRPNKKNDDAVMNKLQIAIQDTGCGMSHAFLRDRLFQAYQQEDPENEGLGLSLTMCRFLVEQMGGLIKANSVEKVGTTFTVSVPVLVRKNKRLEGVSDKSKSPSSSAIARSNRIRTSFIGFDLDLSLQLLQAEIVEMVNTLDDLLEVHPLSLSQELECISARISQLSLICLAPDVFEGQQALFDMFERVLLGIRDTTSNLPNLVVIPAKAHKSSQFWMQMKSLRSIYKGKLSYRLHQLFRPVIHSQSAYLLDLVGSLRKGEVFLHRRRSRKEGNDELTDHAAQKVEGRAANLSIPILPKPEHHAEAQKISQIGASAIHTEHQRDFWVLVVEDNPLNAKILVTMLKRASILYQTASDGLEALEVFEKILPSVVLLDINMPRMNGFDCAVAMRNISSPFKHHIIAITALNGERDRIRGLEAGMDDWYTKPVRLGPLIDNLLERKRSSDEYHV